jgi:hypothetical protein
MLIIKERKDLIFKLEELSTKCGGVLMAAKDGSYLHNFAFRIQEEIKHIACGVENGGIGQHGKHD